MFKENLVAFETITRKEVNRFFRIWTQTILPSAITTTLYFIIFGRFIGSQVSDINGYTYMEFIVPGLIMMTVITNSFSNVVSSFFGTKFMKSIEEMIWSPTYNLTIISGYIFGGVLRGLVVGFVVLIVSTIFTKPNIHNIFIIFLFAFLTAILFSLGGFLNSLYAKKFDDIAIIPTFVLTPLTYLGGVFYSINVLPEFWQNVSKLNPILYMVNGFRYGFLGISDVNVFFSFFMIILFIIIFLIMNVYLMKIGYGLKN